MKAVSIAEVVTSLVGNIKPCGDSYKDDIALENLIKLEETLDYLLDDIQLLIPNANKVEYSMFKIGKEVLDYLDDVRSRIDSWSRDYKENEE